MSLRSTPGTLEDIGQASVRSVAAREIAGYRIGKPVVSKIIVDLPPQSVGNSSSMRRLIFAFFFTQVSELPESSHPRAVPLPWRRRPACPSPLPSSLHRPPDIDCLLHDETIVVTRCGRICLSGKKSISCTVFAGLAVGIKEAHDDFWLVRFGAATRFLFFQSDISVAEPTLPSS